MPKGRPAPHRCAPETRVVTTIRNSAAGSRWFPACPCRPARNWQEKPASRGMRWRTPAECRQIRGTDTPLQTGESRKPAARRECEDRAERDRRLQAGGRKGGQPSKPRPTCEMLPVATTPRRLLCAVVATAPKRMPSVPSPASSQCMSCAATGAPGMPQNGAGPCSCTPSASCRRPAPSPPPSLVPAERQRWQPGMGRARAGPLTPKPTRKSRKTRIWTSVRGRGKQRRQVETHAGVAGENEGQQQRHATAEHQQEIARVAARVGRRRRGPAFRQGRKIERQQRRSPEEKEKGVEGAENPGEWRPRAAGRRHSNPGAGDSAAR